MYNNKYFCFIKQSFSSSYYSKKVAGCDDDVVYWDGDSCCLQEWKEKNYIHTWPKGIFFSFLIVGSFLCFYYFFRQVGVEILCVIFISLTKTKFSITEKKNLPLSWIPSLDLKFTNSFFFFCKISIQNFLHFAFDFFFYFYIFSCIFFRSFGRQRKILFYLTHTQIFYVFFNINFSNIFRFFVTLFY